MRTLSSLLLAAVLASGPAFAQGGFLGITLQDAEGEADGAVVARVEERTAAAIGGLQVGDRITRVDEIAIRDAASLAAVIGERLPGEIVELRLIRGDAVVEQLLVLGRRPAVGRSNAADGGMRPRFDRLPAVPSVPPIPPAPPGEFRFEDGDWDGFEFALPDLPDFERGDFQAQMRDLQERLDELRLHHEELLRSLQERAPRAGEAQPRRRLDLRFGGPGSSEPGVRTRVHLRYPEATPEAERERLRAEAIEKYGTEVEIEFSGTGTSVTIERTLTRSSASTGEPPKDGSREF